MKRLLLTLCMSLSVCAIYAQAAMPEIMAKSAILLRTGIIDMENTTVEMLFLNKIFEKKEQLDGTIATTKYGATRLEGNTYFLDIDIVSGDKTLLTLTFVLLYQEESTLLQKIIVTNTQTKQSEEATAFSDKLQIIQYFLSLQKKL